VSCVFSEKNLFVFFVVCISMPWSRSASALIVWRVLFRCATYR
jgi:hypothetical protein